MVEDKEDYRKETDWGKVCFAPLLFLVTGTLGGIAAIWNNLFDAFDDESTDDVPW